MVTISILFGRYRNIFRTKVVQPTLEKFACMPILMAPIPVLNWQFSVNFQVHVKHSHSYGSVLSLDSDQQYLRIRSRKRKIIINWCTANKYCSQTFEIYKWRLRPIFRNLLAV